MFIGIDLGTTNSLVGSGDTMFTGLVSSNVDMSTKSQVGRDVYGENIQKSYKTSMSMSEGGILPRECSTIILKDLVRRVESQADDFIDGVIISVPAYFSTSQREAVLESAEKAGIVDVQLINEPTAAAIYVCRDLKDLIVVYDLGGGTFDISIVDSRMGNYAVIATDGQNIGGDDFDNALMKRVIDDCKPLVRYRKKNNMDKLLRNVRLAKEELQKTRDDVFIDMSDFGGMSDYRLTVEIYKEVMKYVFWDTVVKTMHLVSVNIPIGEEPKLVFVGGSTSCPYLKEMVITETGLPVVEADCKPDYIVAKGAALYAKMVEKGEAVAMVDDVTKRLCIENEFGNTLTIIDSNSNVPCISSIIVSNSEATDTLRLKLYQGDALVAKANDYIGTLNYKYYKTMQPDEGVVEVKARVTYNGIVELEAQDVLIGESSKQKIKLSAR